MNLEEKFFNFKGKKVDVGLQHFFEPRLFFYSGKLLDIIDGFLILEMKNGIKKIHVNDVIEIRSKQ